MPDVDLLSPTPGDYQALTDLWERSVRATHTFLTEEAISFFYPQVRDIFLPAVTLTAARDRATGLFAGFAGTADGKLEMLFLDPARRGQGLGRRLLEHCLRTQDIQSVDVNEDNPQAVAFYRHMGFTVIGRSEVDGSGKPFPLLHMRLSNTTV